MGISLIHLLPEVRLLLVQALGGEDKYHFNWAELCVACGFFLIVFVEQMVNICQDKLSNDPPEEEVPFASQHGTFGPEVTSDAIKTTSGEEEVIQDSDSDHVALKKRRSSGTSERSCTSASSRHAPYTIEEYAFEHDGHLTPRKAMILLVSLSLHSIFEGLALGLQLDKKDLTDIFIAIGLHKGIEAFTIAVGFAQIKSTLTLKLISTICFAFMSPIGIAIGIPIALFSENDTGEGSSETGTLINGVLQGLATGTFMFVTFIEILPHELHNRKDALVKFFFIVFGFTAITALNALE